MAGRLFRIVLVCAVSGLLITALAQIKSLNSFHKKPAAIGDFQLSLDDDHLKTGQMGDSDWRSSPKTTLLETASILQNHAKAPQGAAERSIRKEKRYDPALGISVESLMARQKASVGVTLVDVRDQRAFQQCRIPGSINVPLYALKTKKFLVSTFVVLTNEGFPCTRLAEQCRQLRASGYMVWILEGGLNAWSEAGAPLEGEQPAQNDLNRLSPRDLFEERDCDRWIAVDARNSKKSKEMLPFSQLISMGSPENTEEFVAPLVDFQKKGKRQPPRSFLVFNEDGKQYEKVEKMIRQAGIKNVFYLKEGLAGYSAFVSQSAAVFQKDGQSRSTIGRCASCP